MGVCVRAHTQDFDRKMCQELHDSPVFKSVYADRKHNLSGGKRKKHVIQLHTDLKDDLMCCLMCS